MIVNGSSVFHSVISWLLTCLPSMLMMAGMFVWIVTAPLGGEQFDLHLLCDQIRANLP